jgi:hypothetical protein
MAVIAHLGEGQSKFWDHLLLRDRDAGAEEVGHE